MGGAERAERTGRVLDEDGAVELLAYLVCSARTQVDEAAEYAPLRLLTAAGRLAEMIEPQAGDRLRALLQEVRRGHSETSVRAGDPQAYVDRLDALCRTLAVYLLDSLVPAEPTSAEPTSAEPTPAEPTPAEPTNSAATNGGTS
ncbi:DUF6092 family protein [Kitasatospora sp. DSM 101779]|uniref:DUF6092 family protein n=1 Tax=Kitasatospora sp. DSM 101779 TaxID=2853165 RepID=UPI0021D85447|nr:DUF6092 family protein [Kitasatospora sp. DSM 101779]MCU7826908.1 hypothetical protein [Kitasatospora sp. DSM 101779]